MTAFRVEKVYYVPGRDQLVLAGEGVARPGMAIELPEAIKGPGFVPILDVQTVRFGDADLTCVVLDYEVVTDHPFMEFRDLEGKSLPLR